MISLSHTQFTPRVKFFSWVLIKYSPLYSLISVPQKHTFVIQFADIPASYYSNYHIQCDICVSALLVDYYEAGMVQSAILLPVIPSSGYTVSEEVQSSPDISFICFLWNLSKCIHSVTSLFAVQVHWCCKTLHIVLICKDTVIMHLSLTYMNQKSTIKSANELYNKSSPEATS